MYATSFLSATSADPVVAVVARAMPAGLAADVRDDVFQELAILALTTPGAALDPPAVRDVVKRVIRFGPTERFLRQSLDDFVFDDKSRRRIDNLTAEEVAALSQRRDIRLCGPHVPGQATTCVYCGSPRTRPTGYRRDGLSASTCRDCHREFKDPSARPAVAPRAVDPLRRIWWGFRGQRGQKRTVDPAWIGPSGFARFARDVGARPDGHLLRPVDRARPIGPSNWQWVTAPKARIKGDRAALPPCRHCGSADVRFYRMSRGRLYVRCEACDRRSEATPCAGDDGVAAAGKRLLTILRREGYLAQATAVDAILQHCTRSSVAGRSGDRIT